MPCLGLSRFHVADDESLLVDRTGGVPDAPGPELVELLPLPVTPGLLDDAQCHVRFQRAVVLLRGKAAHCLRRNIVGGIRQIRDLAHGRARWIVIVYRQRIVRRRGRRRSSTTARRLVPRFR